MAFPQKKYNSQAGAFPYRSFLGSRFTRNESLAPVSFCKCSLVLEDIKTKHTYKKKPATQRRQLQPLRGLVALVFLRI